MEREILVQQTFYNINKLPTPRVQEVNNFVEFMHPPAPICNRCVFYLQVLIRRLQIGASKKNMMFLLVLSIRYSFHYKKKSHIFWNINSKH